MEKDKENERKCLTSMPNMYSKYSDANPTEDNPAFDVEVHHPRKKLYYLCTRRCVFAYFHARIKIQWLSHIIP